MTFSDGLSLLLTPPSLMLAVIETQIGWLPALACTAYWVYRTYNEYKKNH